MSPTETVTVLRQLMDWRRDKSNWPPSPMQIEKAIATAIEMLEHLESDAESLAMHRKVRDERDELRAKIAEMEQQEPVAEWLPLDSGEDTRRD